VDYLCSIETLIPGAQGRVLGALAHAEVEVSLRALAQLAKTSLGQTSVVVARLAELGLVARREVGRATLVRLETENQAAQAVLALRELQRTVLDRLRAEAASITPAPASLLVFGSFARGQARAASDLDVLAVQSHQLRWEDDTWTESLWGWVRLARRLVGNPVELVEVSLEEVPELLARSGSVWQAIATEGMVLAGRPLPELAAAVGAA